MSSVHLSFDAMITLIIYIVVSLYPSNEVIPSVLSVGVSVFLQDLAPYKYMCSSVCRQIVEGIGLKIFGWAVTGEFE